MNAEFDEFARTLFEAFKSFRLAGFADAAALSLTTVLMTNLMAGSQEEKGKK